MKTEILDLCAASRTELSRVASALKKGAVAVFPTDTVYGIGTAADSREGLEKIYGLKGRRPDKPLPLLLPSFAAALPLALFTPAAAAAAGKFWPGQLTIVLKALPPGRAYCHAGANLGLRVPAHDGLLSFLELLETPLAATSANLSGQPSAKDYDSAAELFEGRADFVLAGDCLGLGDSTVLDLSGPEPEVLREGSLDCSIVLSYLKSAAK